LEAGGLHLLRVPVRKREKRDDQARSIIVAGKTKQKKYLHGEECLGTFRDDKKLIKAHTMLKKKRLLRD
jgi:hypothetical protein